MTKKVCIINPNGEYITMFQKQGWEVTNDLPSADLVQFTGGADVSPSLYNKKPHPQTQFSVDRDRREQKLFRYCSLNGKRMAGICRGGQFLNVMCGGKMWQHVNNHGLNGTHSAIDTVTKERFQVTSTHHQMMRPAHHGKVIVSANEATVFETTSKKGDPTSPKRSPEFDTEALWYQGNRVFCFQPHPEFTGKDELAARYINYVNHYLFEVN